VGRSRRAQAIKHSDSPAEIMPSLIAASAISRAASATTRHDQPYAFAMNDL
jgi:hypothetical protein